jgi:hypothetical protein
MREFLFILGVIAVLLLFTAWHYRRQIRAAIEVWRSFRQMYSQVSGKGQTTANVPPKRESGMLVRCAKCGSWTPETTAVRLAPNVFYCSTDCMERTVKAA